MLIEFSVSNFRSFRQKQTFSMVAAPRLRKKNCVFEADVEGEKLPDLLKLAAIYGPNASGKSNLLRALSVVAEIATLTPQSSQRQLPVTPFRFDPGLADEPSFFEVHFIKNRCRYQFELAVTPARIVEERLIAYPRGKESLLYERKFNGEFDVYRIGESLEGGKELHSAWRKLTGPQMLFIAQAVANSSEDLQQLRHPFIWLSGGFSVIDDQMAGWSKIVQVIAASRPMITGEMAKYLRDIDVPVTDISFKTVDGDEQSLLPKDLSSPLAYQELERLVKTAAYKTTLVHKTSLGTAEFDLKEESKGTRNLLAFFLPWTILGNHVVLVDELDSSLHPKIVAALVAKHLNSVTNGQLIFTTHDTHLMDTKILRRDQFWLTERDADGSTQLRSIHDFEGREGEDVEKRYYEGRYRSLPILAQ